MAGKGQDRPDRDDVLREQVRSYSRRLDQEIEVLQSNYRDIMKDARVRVFTCSFVLSRTDFRTLNSEYG